MPKESPLSLGSHTTHTLDQVIDLEEPCWRIMDAHFHRIENLQALHFSLPPQAAHPDFRGKEKAWVGRIAWRLRLLRGRENFTLSFSVEGKVVPWVAVPRPLPLELDFQVLGYIVSNNWEPEDRTQALSTCCLVCLAWYDFCKTKFYTILLRSQKQLKQLRTSLSSAAYPISTNVTELTLTGNEHIYRVAPIHFMKRFPSLKHLAIEGTKRMVPFAPHRSLLMALERFETVTELSLSRLDFQSFWHFRRFIVALPALSHLRLSNVHLPDFDPFNQRVPSLYSTPRNLTSIMANSIKWNPLWLWVLPIHTLPRSTGNPHPRPFLTSSDGGIMAKLVQLRKSRFQTRKDFNWMYYEEHQQCKSSDSDLSAL